jgi:hypothetical protein
MYKGVATKVWDVGEPHRVRARHVSSLQIVVQR